MSSWSILREIEYANEIYDRPKEFVKKSTYDLSDSEEESNVGKMPPSDSEDE